MSERARKGGGKSFRNLEIGELEYTKAMEDSEPVTAVLEFWRYFPMREKKAQELAKKSNKNF